MSPSSTQGTRRGSSLEFSSLRIPGFCRLLGLLGGLLAVANSGLRADTTAPLEPPHRPRIGLVLAGGGARGLGHIGVIRLLEELRVPVDCVAGTSMGSIVGGLYASGYTSDEMVAWLRQCDWDNMLSDSPARQHRGFRAKQEEIETPRWIEFGVDGSGLKTPNAFIAGQNLLFALRRKTEWVGSLRSFDELPVPFRAVATDLETGEMVVLDHGELADAMRASMAVPGVFAPHPLEGRVLIDGFASRNLPVSIARDMGVDVIIAVDVRADLDRADQLGSPVAMVNQLVSILSQRDTIAQIATLGPRDVLVHLKLPGYGASSFRDGVKLADLGYEEAQAVRSGLAALALPEAEYATYQRLRHVERASQPVIVRVEVEGNGRVAAEAVRARLSVQPGERLDRATLENSIRSVYDLGSFQTVDYRIDHRDEGDVLVVTAKEKPWGPHFAIFGLGMNTDVRGASEFNIKGTLRFTQVNRLGAEIAVRGSLGSVDRLGAEFYQPLAYSGRFFIAPRAEFLRTPERYYADLSHEIPGMRPVELAFDRQTLFADVDLGARLGTWGELRFGVGRGTARYTDVRMPSVIVLGPDGTITPLDLITGLSSYTTTRFTGSLVVDHLDSAFFPTRGYYARLAGDHETGARGTSVANLFVTAPARFGDFVLQPFATANYTLESNADQGRLPFRVGGLFNLSGLPTDQVYGANALVGGLIARKRLSAPGSLTSLYLGASLETGNAWDQVGDRLPPHWLVAGSAFIAVDTPLGPLHLAAGAAEGGSYSFYVYLGRILP